MKKLLAIAGLALITVSCQEDEGYSIKGTAAGIEDGKMVYISELQNPNSRPERIDSTTIKDEKFELNPGEVENPNLSFVEIEGLNGNVIFISENEPISFEIYKDSLRSSEVNGGKENQTLVTYLDHLQQTNEKVGEGRQQMQEAFQQRDSTQLRVLQENEAELMDNDKVFKKKMIKENPDSFVSAMILLDMINMKTVPVGEIKELYAELGENVKQTSLAKALKEKLDNESAVAIGSKAPNFTAPTPEGEDLSLEDIRGEVTLIDFWAAWCKPCRVENPNIVKIYEKYHDKGLEVIGVSLDRPGQRDKWLKAIEDDKLPWHQVSNLEFWNEPVAQKYGIRSIPAAFILDKDGIIVARDLRGQQLENKIAELLGEE
ncbi:redoxin domain-containing protein [Salegentibacter sp.]|uniref:redoxin domain-containing protein n=1 Tax=Salegentibacter sp. TaxID=1903072 RepID=UPI00356857CB